MMKTNFFRIITILFCIPIMSYAFTITSFSNSAYNANVTTMNATLGLDAGYIIEDFEDSTIVSGFTVTYDDNGAGGGFDMRSSGNAWDGAKQLVIYSDYASFRNNTYNKQPTFTFAQSLSSFGIGFSDLDQPGWEIYVNGMQVVSDIQANPNWASGRNIYYRIDAGQGEQINTVKIYTSPTSVASTVSDYVGLDHLAFKIQTTTPVPEPMSALLILLAIAGLFIYKR